jgi:hypothetical protein
MSIHPQSDDQSEDSGGRRVTSEDPFAPEPVLPTPDTAGAPASSIPAPKPPVTGDQAVDEAMELISDTFGAELDLQLEAYEAAHQTLQDRLADVES